MAAVIGNLRHDVSTDIVGLLWFVSYVGIRRVIPDNRRCLPNVMRKSIPVGIGAVVSAAYMPNQSLLHVRRFETLWRHDACRQCRR